MNTISDVCKVVGFLSDNYKVYRELTQETEIRNEKISRTCSAAFLGAASVFRVANGVVGLNNGPRGAQVALKIAELFSWMFHATVNAKITEQEIETNPAFQGDEKTVVRNYYFIEKGIMRPALALFRIFSECIVLRDKEFLESFPEGVDQQPRDVRVGYDSILETPVYEKKMYDRKMSEECVKDSTSVAEVFCNAQSVVSLSENFGLGTTAVDLASSLISEIERRRQSFLNNPNPVHQIQGNPEEHHIIEEQQDFLEEDPLIDNEEPVEVDLEVDPFNLLNLPNIPEALHNDEVFSKYICPISLQPIRHPVGDPNGITIYNRDHIRVAIEMLGRSPITQQPLTLQMLVPKPALQALIDHRLQYYQQRLQQNVHEVEHDLTAVNPVLLEAANVENPQH